MTEFLSDPLCDPLSNFVVKVFFTTKGHKGSHKVTQRNKAFFYE
jgi:hypothetical protein